MATRLYFATEDSDYTYEGEGMNFLSNHFPSPMMIDGKEYETVTHYFQSQKFAGTDNEEIVRNAPTPEEAERVGKRLSPLRDDWEKVKFDVMLKGTRAKFARHPTLASILTHGILRHAEIYHTKCGDWWGHPGKNMLGEIIMTVRGEIFEKEDELQARHESFKEASEKVIYEEISKASLEEALQKKKEV